MKILSIRGFSLVELSIVLVILGLLTGGILAGQSLIRAAELRAASSEYTRYSTAEKTFRDKYFALAGDMPNATRFWGDDNAQCADGAIANGTPGTCNGNGNGTVDSTGGGANVTNEMFRYWQHLALAGLIEGSYTGNAGSVSGVDADFGSNAPRSKLSNGGWFSRYLDNSGAATSDRFNYNYDTFYTLGAEGDNIWNDTGILKPEEVWNIDTKMDDGKPAVGNIIVGPGSSCTDATSNTDRAASYKLSSTANNCWMHFKR